MTRFAGLHRLLTGVAEAPLLLRSQTIRSALGRNENPAGETAGPMRRKATNMNAQPLQSKAKIAHLKTDSAVVTEAQQIAQWLARGQSEIFTVPALVGPALAQSLLDRNTGNRPLLLKGSVRSVEAYAEAMKRGEWTLNGEPVIVAATGELNDGQHRLNAVIASGAHIQMLITFGVDRDTRHTVDQGVARTPGHVLAMFGEKHTNQLATALQFTWALDSFVTLNARPSTDQLLSTLERHPRLRDAVREVSHLVNEFRLSSGYIAGAHYRCQEHDRYQADRFLDAVTTGVNIQNINSAVSRLRRQFTEHCAKRQRKTSIEQAANYIKAFNSFTRGRTGQFVWKGNGGEAFPRVGQLS